MPLDETSHEKKTALMALRVQCLSIDTHDPLELAAFWQEALGWRRTHEADDEVALEPAAGSPEDGVSPDLLFLKVGDDKVVKNRLHLDLRPEDQPLEVARLEALGARRVGVGQADDVPLRPSRLERRAARPTAVLHGFPLRGRMAAGPAAADPLRASFVAPASPDFHPSQPRQPR